MGEQAREWENVWDRLLVRDVPGHPEFRMAALAQREEERRLRASVPHWARLVLPRRDGRRAVDSVKGVLVPARGTFAHHLQAYTALLRAAYGAGGGHMDGHRLAVEVLRLTQWGDRCDERLSYPAISLLAEVAQGRDAARRRWACGLLVEAALPPAVVRGYLYALARGGVAATRTAEWQRLQNCYVFGSADT